MAAPAVMAARVAQVVRYLATAAAVALEERAVSEAPEVEAVMVPPLLKVSEELATAAPAESVAWEVPAATAVLAAGQWALGLMEIVGTAAREAQAVPQVSVASGMSM